MGDHILKISDAFWNIRGDLRILGLLNVGTHSSLVQLRSGKFVLLDAYTLEGAVKAEVDARTNGGSEIEAILNLHPFHTLHVEPVHKQYPGAKLFGTRRHLNKFPNLPWQPQLCESPEFAALFSDDLEFSVPEGVDFISSNELLHFSSVLAYHRASRTIHSDDTLMYFRLPGVLGKLKAPEVAFHSSLEKTLERRPAAAKDFRAWATQLATRWGDAENLCAAHSASLVSAKAGGVSIPGKILGALRDVEGTLTKHETTWG